jgi:kumamolisin
MADTRSAGSDYVKLAGSAKAEPEGTRTDTLMADEIAEVTVRVRGSKSLGRGTKPGKRLSREQFEKLYGSSEKDLAAVEEFAHEHHLTIVESSSARKSVLLRGRVKDLEEAFMVSLSHYRDSAGNVYRCRSGEISVPKSLGKIIEGVHGLDNRPLVRPMFQVAKRNGVFIDHSASPRSFTPDTLAGVYGFPKGATGKGVCIGIIELGEIGRAHV